MTSQISAARRERIRAFILEHAGGNELDDRVDIFESGLVRSMFVMQLVLFVEQEFGIEIGGADLDFSSFRSVEALDSLVGRKLAG